MRINLEIQQAQSPASLYDSITMHPSWQKWGKGTMIKMVLTRGVCSPIKSRIIKSLLFFFFFNKQSQVGKYYSLPTHLVFTEN